MWSIETAFDLHFLKQLMAVNVKIEDMSIIESDPQKGPERRSLHQTKKICS
jgi:hypothetical protein